MAATNLHTLDNDILHELLTLCHDLNTLYSLLLTHPIIYQAFRARRRLILRHVFARQIRVQLLSIPADAVIDANEDFVVRIERANPIDAVAFREAVWPILERRLFRGVPSKLSWKWATALLTIYRKAELREDALSFAKRTIGLALNTVQWRQHGTLPFIRAVGRIYMAAHLFQETLSLQETVHGRLKPLSIEHSSWGKELVATLQHIGDPARVLRFQLTCWELYKEVAGSNSPVALDWARGIVREYQAQGKIDDALRFHQEVRMLLDPTTAPYIAWSRQLINMLQQRKQDAEALVATEQVWRHLNPETKGYRAWTMQLSDQYEAMGRHEEAIAVCEVAWNAITERLKRLPADVGWRYHARGAGFTLLKVYQRHNRLEHACLMEAQCKELMI